MGRSPSEFTESARAHQPGADAAARSTSAPTPTTARRAPTPTSPIVSVHLQNARREVPRGRPGARASCTAWRFRRRTPASSDPAQQADLAADAVVAGRRRSSSPDYIQEQTSDRPPQRCCAGASTASSDAEGRWPSVRVQPADRSVDVMAPTEERARGRHRRAAAVSYELNPFKGQVITITDRLPRQRHPGLPRAAS